MMMVTTLTNKKERLLEVSKSFATMDRSIDLSNMADASNSMKEPEEWSVDPHPAKRRISDNNNVQPQEGFQDSFVSSDSSRGGLDSSQSVLLNTTTDGYASGSTTENSDDPMNEDVYEHLEEELFSLEEQEWEAEQNGDLEEKKRLSKIIKTKRHSFMTRRSALDVLRRSNDEGDPSQIHYTKMELEVLRMEDSQREAFQRGDLEETNRLKLMVEEKKRTVMLRKHALNVLQRAPSKDVDGDRVMMHSTKKAAQPVSSSSTESEKPIQQKKRLSASFLQVLRLEEQEREAAKKGDVKQVKRIQMLVHQKKDTIMKRRSNCSSAVDSGSEKAIAERTSVSNENYIDGIGKTQSHVVENGDAVSSDPTLVTQDEHNGEMSIEVEVHSDAVPVSDSDEQPIDISVDRGGQRFSVDAFIDDEANHVQTVLLEDQKQPTIMESKNSSSSVIVDPGPEKYSGTPFTRKSNKTLEAILIRENALHVLEKSQSRDDEDGEAVSSDPTPVTKKDEHNSETMEMELHSDAAAPAPDDLGEQAIGIGISVLDRDEQASLVVDAFLDDSKRSPGNSFTVSKKYTSKVEESGNYPDAEQAMYSSAKEARRDEDPQMMVPTTNSKTTDENKNTDERERNLKLLYTMIIGVVFAFLFIFVLALVLAFLLTGKDDDPVEPSVPLSAQTPAPALIVSSSVPSPAPSVDALSALVGQLLNDPEFPSSEFEEQAMTWLTNQQQAQQDISADTDPYYLLERYIFALFYSSSRMWLLDDDVCDWGKLICNENNTVVEMSMCKSS
jgi:hypothetical protein